MLSATQTGLSLWCCYDKTKKILVYKDTLALKLKEISILKVFKDKDFGGGLWFCGADLTKL